MALFEKPRCRDCEVSIEFLRPAVAGDELTAVASENHRGRRSGYYTVEVRNQREELVALFRGRSASSGKPVIQT